MKKQKAAVEANIDTEKARQDAVGFSHSVNYIRATLRQLSEEGRKEVEQMMADVVAKVKVLAAQ